MAAGTAGTTRNGIATGDNGRNMCSDARTLIFSCRTIQFMTQLLASSGFRLCLFLCLILSFGHLHAQDTVEVGPPFLPVLSGAPVVFEQDTVLTVYGTLGPFSPAMRAESIRSRLYAILDDERLAPDSIRVVTLQGNVDIVLDSLIIMAVTAEDALMMRSTPRETAQQYATRLQTALTRARALYSTHTLLVNGGIALGILILSLLLLWLMTKIFPKLYARVERSEAATPSVRVRSYTVVSGARLNDFFVLLFKGLRLVLTLLLIYFGVTITLALFPWTRNWNIGPLLQGLLTAGLLTVVTIVSYRGLHRLARYLHLRLHELKGTHIKPVRLKEAELLSSERIVEMAQFGLRSTRLFLDVVLLYFYITILFSLFSFTSTWAGTLFAYITTPLRAVVDSFINFLPNIFVILVTSVVAFYLMRFMRWIFLQVENGSIELPHFYPEWARPTYGIVRLLIIVFVVIIIFPYLPGSGSPAFQNVSLFLGLLLSISSASAVANAIAGVVLTYMRPFRVGDRVRIADTMGDVVEKSILVTRVRTIKNVEITIPNAMVLNSHLINFSTSAQDRGLILNTKITIGYDVPWRSVHELLIAAAAATDGVLSNPKPFVLQTALNDFYVEYEINAYTNQPNAMAKLYSELHSHIQDRFNEAGVEIMSPHYGAMRDGNQTTIPQDYLPKSYEPPSFRLFGNLFGGGKRPGNGENTGAG